MSEEPSDNPSGDLTPSESNGSANVPQHIGVLRAINQLTVLWAQSQACRVDVQQARVMIKPVPGRPGMTVPTGDVKMIFTFKMPPKVIGA